MAEPLSLRLYSLPPLPLSSSPEPIARPSGDGEGSEPMARAEALQRDLRFEIMGPPVRLYSNFIRGIRSLPVRIVS